MKYIAVVIILSNAAYILSFAKYNFNEKNSTAGIGAVLLALISVAVPFWVILKS